MIIKSYSNLYDASFLKIQNYISKLITSIHSKKLNKDSQYNSAIENSIDAIMSTLNHFIPDENTFSFYFDKLDNSLEIYPFFVYIFTAMFCLLSSSIYHLFSPCSPTVHKLLHRFDLAGISILNFGSSFSLFFYYFYCSLFYRNLYSFMIFVCSFFVFIVSLFDKIHHPKNVKYKSIMYAALGLSNIIPCAHLQILAFYAGPHNDYMPLNICFLLIYGMAALYLVGLVFYNFKIPERFFPKTFDIWFNSHTIWHIFVFLAALEHFYNMTHVYSTRSMIPCLSK